MKPPEIIASRRHPLVKELQEIRDNRQSSSLFLEGPRLVQEAVNSGKGIDILVWTPARTNDTVLESALLVAKKSAEVKETVFSALSDVETPQGILAVIGRPIATWDELLRQTPAPIVILDGIQDPGNLAAIVRTAEAAGAAGIVTTPGTAHLYSPKALRGAMGSTLRLPCLDHQSIPQIFQELTKASYQIHAASMMSSSKASVPYTSIDWKTSVALLLGQEGGGLSGEWETRIKLRLHIPMRPPVESLNVAAAAAILLYEYSRQNT